MATTRICSMPGCSKLVAARDLCGTHYARWWRRGTTDLKPVRLCSIEGCDEKHWANGYCRKHNWSRYAYGDPMESRGISLGTARAFLEAAIVSETDKCINWPFAVTQGGYGQITIDGNQLKTHVEVCERVHGYRANPEFEVRHLCGNGHLGCINPRHLKWGTRKENCEDMLTHGTRRMGETFPTAKLLNDEVGEVRRRLAAGERNCDIARLFGVGVNVIEGVKYGRTYRRVV